MQIIETKRLSLELFTPEDSPFVFKLMNSPTWMEYIGDRGIKSEKDAVSYITTNFLSSYATYGFGFYKIILKEKKVPIGICGFIKHDFLEHPDIGFAILPQFEGKGYIGEAAMETLDYGVNTIKLDPVYGVTTENNMGSRRILTKIGLQEIGTVMDGDKELLLFTNSP